MTLASIQTLSLAKGIKDEQREYKKNVWFQTY